MCCHSDTQSPSPRIPARLTIEFALESSHPRIWCQIWLSEISSLWLQKTRISGPPQECTHTHTHAPSYWFPSLFEGEKHSRCMTFCQILSSPKLWMRTVSFYLGGPLCQLLDAWDQGLGVIAPLKPHPPTPPLAPPGCFLAMIC